MNANFAAISTLLNTTKLDSTNLQDAGILVSKLNPTGFTAGQVIAFNGSVFAASGSSLTTQFNVVLGSAAEVTAGTATNSTFASVVQADDSRVLILTSYVTAENWVVTKRLFITGIGYGSRVNGTITFSSTADDSMLMNCRVSDNITMQAGADQIVVAPVFLDSGKTFLIDSTVTGEYVLGLPA